MKDLFQIVGIGVTLPIHLLLCCYSSLVNRLINFLKLKAAVMMCRLHSCICGGLVRICLSMKMVTK